MVSYDQVLLGDPLSRDQSGVIMHDYRDRGIKGSTVWRQVIDKPNYVRSAGRRGYVQNLFYLHRLEGHTIFRPSFGATADLQFHSSIGSAVLDVLPYHAIPIDQA